MPVFIGALSGVLAEEAGEIGGRYKPQRRGYLVDHAVLVGEYLLGAGNLDRADILGQRVAADALEQLGKIERVKVQKLGKVRQRQIRTDVAGRVVADECVYMMIADGLLSSGLPE